MSIKFDEKTGNLLEPSTVGRRLTFVSITGEVYPATDEDTLIYQEDSITTSLTQHDNLFKNALEDPTNPRKIKYCQKCKKDELVVMIRIKNDLINFCSVCGSRWIEGV